MAKSKASTKPYQKANQKSGKSRSRNYTMSKKLENTTRIRIDLDRINDSNSLDTSFLDGRKSKKVEKSPKEKKKILESKPKVDKSSSRNMKIYTLLVILGIIVILIALFYRNFFRQTEKKSLPIPVEEEIVLDSNYLFVGDYYTKDFPFEELNLDYHYVKISDEKLTTQSLLKDISTFVYQYNPSDVVLQVGMNDLLEGENSKDVLENLKKIIIGIQQNRMYSRIYIESLYPIYSERYENLVMDDIEKFNQQLESLAKQLGITYLDIYSLLSEDGLCKEEYTDDGESLNQDAYEDIFRFIQTVLE